MPLEAEYVVNEGCRPVQLDRRAFPRRQIRGTACCRLINRPFSRGVVGRLVDISQGGVGILVPGCFQIGDVLALEVSPVTARRPLARAAEVRWAELQPEGGQRVGCSWIDRLPYAELQQFS
jgi:hypothetical protein